MPDRSTLSHEFLTRAGWVDANRRFLAGDASDRSYDRLTRGAETAVLMDAPPGKGDDPATFMAIARHLTGIGLSAPQVLAADLTNGFLLLEDLGDTLFARLTMADPSREPELYAAATDVLVHLQRHKAPPGLPDPSAQDWAQAAAFALDWYRFAITGDRIDPAAFVACLTEVLTTHADGPRVMILRDYHAENLLWMPDRAGLARVGLLDFQLAQMGQPGYDLVSLLQDARREVTEVTETAMKARFRAATGADEMAFSAAYAALGAQRALRILGIFARLCLRDGKRHYVALMPRVWGQLQRNLAHPALAPLAQICQDLLPVPTPARLERIAAACAKPPTP
ncbi:aminoglycoside phosphotransferase family protein [Rhodobacter ferrooxidans]|uniref:Aminoglycoside phosphotransferase n=1 Tax=Rhodobacter ferrooxidans TaxID=371731 RepID=C8S134_9RHOB|nr:aminoglycoside phosphotransferase [Rhodobacter sp. SW2]